MSVTVRPMVRIAGELRPDDRSNGLHLSLLRHFQLTSHEGPICLPLSGQRIVAYLALREGPITRAGLAAVLWPDAAEDRAMANLRSAIWRVNRPGLRLIEATPDHAALMRDITIDFRELMPAVIAILARSGKIDRHIVANLAQADELLPDWYDDWIVFERERFRQLRLHALESLCEQLTDGGEFALAIDMGLAAVGADPLRETARRALIRAFLAEGNRAEAIGQYTSYRRLLRIELDVAPSEHIDAMVRGLEPKP
ncbi:MAG TPA: BTAD domain-containing putative transcriptional regulator [Streptosporangiaceae bacterium]